jgi:hypothetical protein
LRSFLLRDVNRARERERTKLQLIAQCCLAISKKKVVIGGTSDLVNFSYRRRSISLASDGNFDMLTIKLGVLSGVKLDRGFFNGRSS